MRNRTQTKQIILAGCLAVMLTVALAAPVSDQELKDAVTEAGYEVVSIQ